MKNLDILIAAAVAVGYKPLNHQPDNCVYVQYKGRTFAWNPIMDDVDAFKLAAEHIGTYTVQSWRVSTGGHRVVITKADGCNGVGEAIGLLDATRLAIVNTVINNFAESSYHATNDRTMG